MEILSDEAQETVNFRLILPSNFETKKLGKCLERLQNQVIFAPKTLDNKTIISILLYDELFIFKD